MKAYISYSVGEEEMPVITRLSWGLRDEGYIPVSGTLSSPEIEMRNASLFIGVVTAIGSRQERVLGEWELARQKQIPYLMLIEQDCWHISQLKLEDNVIIFDRNDPDKATKIITKRITASKKEKCLGRCHPRQ